MRVAGSGTSRLGTLAFKNSTAHCGRTVKLCTAGRNHDRVAFGQRHRVAALRLYNSAAFDGDQNLH